jgi:hypothetical protein
VVHHLIFHCFKVLKFDDAPPKFPSFDLKGQSRKFLIQIFFMNHLPQAPE